MTHRFLSMKSDWIELVNELQKYNLRPEVLYKLYTNVLPKKKQWLRYIKGKKDMQYEKWVLEIVAKHYQVSISEAIGYLDVYMMSEGGKIELVEILNKYGTDPKLIKKLKL